MLFDRGSVVALSKLKINVISANLFLVPSWVLKTGYKNKWGSNNIS